MIARVRRVLISVSEKDGVVEFAKALAALRIEILSTGGTAQHLAEAGVPVKEIEVYTGFPEILGGRVKTLHPVVHGGILALRDQDKQMQELAAHGIRTIDLVVVNLYPFEQAAKRAKAVVDDLIEEIDIGGVTLIRAAAKNAKWVGVVTHPGQYEAITQELTSRNGSLSDATRQRLAVEAFAATAAYDAMIHHVLNNYLKALPGLPETFFVFGARKRQSLRYGENPHQIAAWYDDHTAAPSGLSRIKQLHGKELSFNNLLDMDAAVSLVAEFSEPAAVIVKHNNPCGVAVETSIDAAFERAHACDPLAAFGGIVAVNREISKDLADTLAKYFLEVVVTPHFAREALDPLTKKKAIRLIELKGLGVEAVTGGEGWDVKSIQGGWLIQQLDRKSLVKDDVKLVTTRVPSDQEMEDALFAWTIAKHAKSNAIIIAKGRATIGLGVGQVSRVGSVKMACAQAGGKAAGASLASDGFFPKPDGVEAAAQAGVTTIIQPGGSVEDKAVIAEAEKHGMAMLFTSLRHFKH